MTARIIDGKALAQQVRARIADDVARLTAEHGVQPGGSVRDEEVIAAADEHGIPMVFTGRRHFRH